MQNTANFIGILFAGREVTGEADYNKFGEKKKENKDLREVKKKGLSGGKITKPEPKISYIINVET